MLSYRERFKKCMAHEPLDRPPMDVWLDSNNPKVKADLLKYTGFDTYEDLLDAYEIDIWRTKPGVLPEFADTELEFHRFFMPNVEAKYLTLSSEIERPLISIEDPKELHDMPWPAPDIFAYESLIPLCEPQKDRVIWVQPGTWSPIFARMCDLSGMEKVLMDMILNPDLTYAVIERIYSFYYEVFKRTLEAGRGIIDVFSFGDDYATQLDMMIDVKHWRQYFKEPARKLIELAKSYGSLVAFHSCGAIDRIIPDLIEIGVDILFPIQPLAKGMGAERLKKEYGKDLVFYGGVDVQHILPHGTEKEVREEVARVLDVFGTDGGYILCSGHSILEDVPNTNIVAMYDEAIKIAKRRERSVEN